MKFVLLYLQVLIMSSTSNCQLPDVSEFFPSIEDDLSKIKWAHGVNKRKDLMEALEDDYTMMLEADVSDGHIVGNSNESGIPIMAHPPMNSSDIALSEWIDEVIWANEKGVKKGVKLDFKDLSIVKQSMQQLRNHAHKITFPLWLNADILKGPGEMSRDPVDKDIFISLCTEFFPDATLSLGWTTSYTEGEELLSYTPQMIQEMSDALERNGVVQPVTFPLRALYVPRSGDAISQLLELVPDSTVTVWTGKDDPVDIPALVSSQENFGEDSLYFDLLSSQMEEFERIREIKAESDRPTISIAAKVGQNIVMATIATVAAAMVGLFFYGE